jgi:hypothetical protein
MLARRSQVLLGAAAVGTALLLIVGAKAQDPAAPEKPEGAPQAGQPEQPAEPMFDPKTIWPAGLEQVAGHYVFYQVASPGGFWEAFYPARGRSIRRQASINEVPAAFRERLLKAEVIISDLKTPTTIVANERLSPSKRGMLRFYTETAEGRLTLRGLPGIGASQDDTGTFSGRVLFTIDHQSHSNPSVAGVLQTRIYQEPTWGVATLDYADLNAVALPPETPAGQAPEKAAPKPGAEDPDDVPPVMANARILRSGIEIFAFVEWRQKQKQGESTYTGSVRLIRRDQMPKEPEPGAAPAPIPSPRRLPPGQLPPAPISRLERT